MPRTYIASLEIEVLLTVQDDTDQYELEDLARRAIEEDVKMRDDDIEIEDATYIPCGWDENCYVYGNMEKDINAVEAMKYSETYLENQKREKAKKERKNYENILF